MIDDLDLEIYTDPDHAFTRWESAWFLMKSSCYGYHWNFIYRICVERRN